MGCVASATPGGSLVAEINETLQKQTETIGRIVTPFKASFVPRLAELKKTKPEPTKEDIEKLCKEIVLVVGTETSKALAEAVWSALKPQLTAYINDSPAPIRPQAEKQVQKMVETVVEKAVMAAVMKAAEEICKPAPAPAGKD
jgi:hypothetical protein